MSIYIHITFLILPVDQSTVFVVAPASHLAAIMLPQVRPAVSQTFILALIANPRKDVPHLCTGVDVSAAYCIKNECLQMIFPEMQSATIGQWKLLRWNTICS